MEKSKNSIKEKKQTIHPERLEQVTGGYFNLAELVDNPGQLNPIIKNRLKDNGQITS